MKKNKGMESLLHKIGYMKEIGNQIRGMEMGNVNSSILNSYMKVNGKMTQWREKGR